ncbi:MAG: 2-oxoacid:acceptor oxidoreductase family protein [Candidatus Omnitrophica bacterium]|nr:2-oxoacid:acceptor oxidoreductase family protein [Candidatus Omnitrophota bacterium]
MKEINEEIICAGFGGQGIMLMGKLIAETGMSVGYNVTWFPSYGAEVRGGTAHSMIHISSQPIASPTVSVPSICIVMNGPSLAKFMDRVKENGLLIINTSMVDKVVEKKSIKIAMFPFTDLASELGNIKTANMIAVGALIGLKKLFSLENTLKQMCKLLPDKGDIVSVNREALKLGYKLATEG